MAGAAERLFAALHATWPPASWQDAPGWRVGVGAGGGQRVSCGLAQGPDADPDALAQAQCALGQTPLAMVRPGETALDHALAARGWAMRDPTLALAAPIGLLASEPPRVTAFTVEGPPLTVQRDIWAAGGIGAGRLAVMARVERPKLTLLGRARDRPAAAGFVACHEDIAVVHALEVAPAFRRAGMARALMQAAALWGADAGARRIAVFVTRANAPARALYAGLGMAEATGYHYRVLPD